MKYRYKEYQRASDTLNIVLTHKKNSYLMCPGPQMENTDAYGGSISVRVTKVTEIRENDEVV